MLKNSESNQSNNYLSLDGSVVDKNLSLDCGYANDEQNSIELYCLKLGISLPTHCLPSFFLANITDKSKVNHLKVVGCEPDQINRFLIKFPNLYSLDISSSGLVGLTTLKHDQLVKLNASFNDLIIIPTLELPAAREIDFSYNQLNVHTNGGLPSKLVKIYFSHNHFMSFDGDQFKNLTDLEYIDLSYNEIRRNHGTLEQNKNLKTLNLDGNRLGQAADSFGSLIKSGVSVSVSWKYIELLKWDDLDTTNMGVVHNSGKEGIFQSSDGKTEIHCNANSFEWIAHFMVGNHFENIAEILHCMSTFLNGLYIEGNFDDEQIKSLHLDKFTILRNFALENTMISQFDLNIIKKFRNLYVLTISNNKNLRKFDNVEALEGLPNLHRISLSNNQLEDIHGILQNLCPFIYYIDISNNNLKNIPSLMKFQLLRHLDASNCNLKKISELTTELGSMVEELQLSGNNLNELEMDTFKSVTRLKVLNLTNTNLSHVDFDMFESTPQLEMLDLSYNHLQSVNFTSEMNELKAIYLTGNNITEMDGFTKTHLPKLSSVGIAENSLSCEYLTTLVEQIKSKWPRWVSTESMHPSTQKQGQNCQSGNK